MASQKAQKRKTNRARKRQKDINDWLRAGDEAYAQRRAARSEVDDLYNSPLSAYEIALSVVVLVLVLLIVAAAVDYYVMALPEPLHGWMNG